MRQEHLRGSRKHLKDLLLLPPPRAQGCPSGGRARWSPRGWSSSPCSGPAASFTFSRCQLFHHPLLTKCLLRAIGRSRSENRLKGHVWNESGERLQKKRRRSVPPKDLFSQRRHRESRIGTPAAVLPTSYYPTPPRIGAQQILARWAISVCTQRHCYQPTVQR